MQINTAVLISGRGSNLKALLEAARKQNYPARISLVISNEPNATGIMYAREAQVAVQILDHRPFSGREDFEEALHKILLEAEIELVCCAGFMRLFTSTFVNRWRNRLLNIHPSLLPAFRGLDVHKRVLESGVRITGCSVHFIRPAMDEGPIIAQAAIPVMPEDTPQSLSERLLKVEHQIYPHALALVAKGMARPTQGERVGIPEFAHTPQTLFVPPL